MVSGNTYITREWVLELTGGNELLGPSQLHKLRVWVELGTQSIGVKFTHGPNNLYPEDQT